MFEVVAEEVFRRYGRNWKPGTFAVNRGYDANQILPWFRGQSITDITNADVREWFDRGREPSFPGPPAQIPASALTHRAPPLGSDDEPLGWPRVADASLGPVGCGEEFYVLPFCAIPLGPSPKGTHEQPSALAYEPLQVMATPVDGIIVELAIDD